MLQLYQIFIQNQQLKPKMIKRAATKKESQNTNHLAMKFRTIKDRPMGLLPDQNNLIFVKFKSPLIAQGDNKPENQLQIPLTNTKLVQKLESPKRSISQKQNNQENFENGMDGDEEQNICEEYNRSGNAIESLQNLQLQSYNENSKQQQLQIQSQLNPPKNHPEANNSNPLSSLGKPSSQQNTDGLQFSLPQIKRLSMQDMGSHSQQNLLHSTKLTSNNNNYARKNENHSLVSGNLNKKEEVEVRQSLPPGLGYDYHSMNNKKDINQKPKYSEIGFKKRMLERHKIISNLEQQDNFSRKNSLEHRISLQQVLPISQSLKLLPPLFSPTQSSNFNSTSHLSQQQQQPQQQQQYHNLLSPQPNDSSLNQRLILAKQRTTDMRLVLDEAKKIKFNHQKELKESDTTNQYIHNNQFRQMSEGQFKQVFKKAKLNKNQLKGFGQSSDIDNQQGSDDQQERKKAEILAYLQKKNQVFVILNEIKTPVAPVLRVGLFKVPSGNYQALTENQLLLDGFIKEVNLYFNRSDQRLSVKHLFLQTGEIVQYDSQIQSSQIFVIGSLTATYQEMDPRLTKRLILRTLYKHIQMREGRDLSQGSLKDTSASANFIPSKKITKDMIAKRAQELIDQQKSKKEVYTSDSDSHKSFQEPVKKPSRQKKRGLNVSNLKQNTERAQFDQEHDKIIEAENEKNKRPVQETHQRNQELQQKVILDNQQSTSQALLDPKISTLNEAQKSLVKPPSQSTADLKLEEKKLAFNSPLAELQSETVKFNKQMQRLKQDLDYKLEVFTKKQVDQSIKEIQERTQKQLKQKYLDEDTQTNAEIYKRMMLDQKQNQIIADPKNRKIHALIYVVQKYLKQVKIDKKKDAQKKKQMNQGLEKQSQMLPDLNPNRKNLVSKWDHSSKKQSSALIRGNSQRFIGSLDKSIFGQEPEQPKSPKIIPATKNFIEQNINNIVELKKNVFLQFGSAFEKNIPTLESRSGFTRQEIIKIFASFKALCEMTLKELRSQNQDLAQCKGVSFEKFKTGIPELKFENEKFARRIFDQCNVDKQSKYLDWDHFLLAIKAIQARNVDKKIDLFFRIIDEDGNGQLSYDEIYAICSSSFERFTPKLEEDIFMKALTEFFVSIIFRAVGKELDEEIPLQDIKDAIEKNIPDSDLLLMFCNANKD